MKEINEKVMSDEETDPDEPNVFIKRSPLWRSQKLNSLVAVLDKQYGAKHGTFVKKTRKIGQPSERVPPRGLPKWAISSNYTVPSPSVPQSSTSTASNSSIVNTPSRVQSSRGQHIQHVSPLLHSSHVHHQQTLSPSNLFTTPTSSPITQSNCQLSDYSVDEDVDDEADIDIDSELNDWISDITGTN